MASIAAPLSEIISSLYGTLRLAQGDTGGMNFFNISPEGFWRSFTAAVLIAPLFFILLSVRYLVSDSDIPLARYTSIHAISYIIGWVAFPLLFFHLADILGIGQRFIRFIVSYNWASVLQNIVYLPFALLVEAQVLQGPVANFIGILLLGLVFFYIWFVTRTALEISNFLAIGFVVIDFMLSVFINSVTQGMLRIPQTG
ncbi:MAG: hypothetical protein HN884_01575 [Rhodospirillaceae bacterium]|jgi:hypothetical protein|nr:hypothetical protein [Rhodospirillaceae bacterium]